MPSKQPATKDKKIKPKSKVKPNKKKNVIKY